MSSGDRLDALERRLAALEAAPARSAASGPEVGDGPGTWWLLDVLADRTGPGFERDGAAGSVVLGGRVRAEGAGEVAWQVEHAVPDVLDVDPQAAAHVLAALGNPVRLRLLVALVRGARTLADLAALPGMGTSGQLHHHLRELRAAGLVVQPGRSRYAVPADRVVPLLVAIALAVGPDVVGRPTPDHDHEGTSPPCSSARSPSSASAPSAPSRSASSSG